EMAVPGTARGTPAKSRPAVQGTLPDRPGDVGGQPRLPVLAARTVPPQGQVRAAAAGPPPRRHDPLQPSAPPAKAPDRLAGRPARDRRPSATSTRHRHGRTGLP